MCDKYGHLRIQLHNSETIVGNRRCIIITFMSHGVLPPQIYLVPVGLNTIPEVSK